jgi:putative hydrolase of the HAD superfamily
MQLIAGRQHLIFDADDTLWENNIYFEEAFAEFCEYLNHSSLTADEIRGILDDIEIVNAKIHGYGAVNFGRNLSQCYLRLAERAVDEHDLKRVTAIAHQILARAKLNCSKALRRPCRFWPRSTN